MPVNDFSCGAAWTWVDAATRGSADACGHGREFGSLIEGQAADFLILDMGRPETLPSWDFEWELVRYYNRDQIDAVIVNGNVVMAGGRPVAWDEREFVREYTKIGIKIGSVPGIERRHGPSSGYRALEIGPSQLPRSTVAGRGMAEVCSGSGLTKLAMSTTSQLTT
jgi:5-methylthioadenosine/S-adenosylhomocysteine deaminase